MADEYNHDDDPYDDDPYSNDEPLPELAIRLLDAHREDPAADSYFLLAGASLTETDAAYTALNKEGLIQYTDRIIEVADDRRHTVNLTRNGL